MAPHPNSLRVTINNQMTFPKLLIHFRDDSFQKPPRSAFRRKVFSSWDIGESPEWGARRANSSWHCHYFGRWPWASIHLSEPGFSLCTVRGQRGDSYQIFSKQPSCSRGHRFLALKRSLLLQCITHFGQKVVLLPRVHSTVFILCTNRTYRMNSKGHTVLPSPLRDLTVESQATKDNYYSSSTGEWNSIELEVKTATWSFWALHPSKSIDKEGSCTGWVDWFWLQRGDWDATKEVKKKLYLKYRRFLRALWFKPMENSNTISKTSNGTDPSRMKVWPIPLPSSL